MSTVYISGPITGIPDYELNFKEVENYYIWCSDWDYVNPINFFNWLNPTARALVSQEEYMLESIKHLVNCDYICMLPGWENSKGAKLEKLIAEAIGLGVFYWQDGKPVAAEHFRIVEETKPNLDESIDAEARRVVYGDRGKVYGPATGDFERTGKMWAPILGLNEPVSPERVAACMIALKMSRLHNTPEHRDSMVDIIGYTLCMKDIMDEKESSS